MFHWILCRLGFGGLTIIEDCGAWRYTECVVCGRRWADNLTGRSGPRDDQWIETGEWTQTPENGGH